MASVELNITENANFHRTSKYELTQDRTEGDRHHAAQLVVRRGQPFDVTVKLDRPFDKERDDVKLIFTVGKYGLDNVFMITTVFISNWPTNFMERFKKYRQYGFHRNFGCIFTS